MVFLQKRITPQWCMDWCLPSWKFKIIAYPSKQSVLDYFILFVFCFLAIIWEFSMCLCLFSSCYASCYQLSQMFVPVFNSFMCLQMCMFCVLFCIVLSTLLICSSPCWCQCVTCIPNRDKYCWFMSMLALECGMYDSYPSLSFVLWWTLSSQALA